MFHPDDAQAADVFDFGNASWSKWRGDAVGTYAGETEGTAPL